MIDRTQQTAAKVAGALYLLTIAVVVYANFAIHERLNVTGDAAATARNILAHEQLFRLGLVCDLLYCAGGIALLVALYVIFEPVSRGLALLSTLWKLVYLLVWVLMTVQFYDVLRLLHGAAYLRVFEPDRLQALAKLTLNGGFDRYYGGLLFYGLSATVASWLWVKSAYIPKFLGVGGLISNAWCALCAFAFLLTPAFSKVVNLWWFDTPMGLFEIATGVWLLFKGLQPWNESQLRRA